MNKTYFKNTRDIFIIDINTINKIKKNSNNEVKRSRQNLHRSFKSKIQEILRQIQVQQKDGKLKRYLVEVKPAKQCVPPEYPGRQTKRYLQESFTYIKNQAKWKAATEYCKDRGWEFKIITEKELGLV
jgi:hypothetical protein